MSQLMDSIETHQHVLLHKINKHHDANIKTLHMHKDHVVMMRSCVHVMSSTCGELAQHNVHQAAGGTGGDQSKDQKVSHMTRSLGTLIIYRHQRNDKQNCVVVSCVCGVWCGVTSAAAPAAHSRRLHHTKQVVHRTCVCRDQSSLTRV